MSRSQFHRRQCLMVPDVSEAALRRAGEKRSSPAVAKLIADAEAALRKTPPSVMDKLHMPPSGDKRDYFSLSIYYWPDPDKPDGLPYIPRDGQVNPETAEYDHDRFVSMGRCVDTLTQAYTVTDDERYADKASQFLRMWFLDERTGMKPNMLFAQHVPGDHVTTPWPRYPARYVPGTGGRKGVYVSFGGVIEDCSLVPLTDSIRLLRPSPHWTHADEAAMRDWLAAYTHWLRTHQHGRDEAACENNHGSWYWADIACFLEFLGRGDEVGPCLDQVLPERLRLQVEPDGSQPEELVRTASMGYVGFTLTSLANIAIAADRCGYDAWSVTTDDGRSIRKAFDWFVPYLTGQKQWTWPQLHAYDTTRMVLPLAACAQRFPDGGYGRAIAAMPAPPADARCRLWTGIHC